MKHLHDDELLMSALDGIDDLDLSQLDSKQAKEFQALSLLKSDLKLLNDIPECQLSSERLRRRILEEGMQPKAQPRGWFWFASAGAISCACMAAAAVMIWNWYQPSAPTASQAVALSNPSTSSEAALEPEIKWEEAEFGEAPKAPAVAVEPKVEIRQTEPAPKRTVRKSSRSRTTSPVMEMAAAVQSGVGLLAKRTEVEPAPVLGADAANADLAQPLEAPAALQTPQPQAVGRTVNSGAKPASVVVISQASTPEPTVESAGHVVFGG